METRRRLMWPFTKKTEKQTEVNVFPRDLFTAQFKEITEEEGRQKICGEFVKKVNNMV